MSGAFNEEMPCGGERRRERVLKCCRGHGSMSEAPLSPILPVDELFEPASMEVPSTTSPGKFQGRREHSNRQRGALQALVARIDAQDEAIRRLGATFAMLSTLQEHSSLVPRTVEAWAETPSRQAPRQERSSQGYYKNNNSGRGGRGGGYRSQRGHAPGFRAE